MGIPDAHPQQQHGDITGNTLRLCVDASSRQRAAMLAGTACPHPDVQQSGDTFTVDGTCTIAGITATSHTVITGNLDSAYTMTGTSYGAQGKMTMTTSARRLGPCAAVHKPGT